METYLYYNFDHPNNYGPFLEEWKPISNFEPFYKISNYGRVYSERNGMLKMNKDKDGYIDVKLFGIDIISRIYVHRLLAIHFIPNPENKPEVNHKLGYKWQNVVFEIEWNTFSENIKHSFDVLGHKGPDNLERRKSFLIIKGNISCETTGIRSTAKDLNIPYQAIQRILKGNRSTYNGFTFNYKS